MSDIWSMPQPTMGTIENPAEPHLPCAILCDVSGTMAPYMKTLNDSLVDVLRPIFKNGTARGRAEVAIFAYDWEVRMVTPFQSIYDYHDNGYSLPTLTHRQGITNTYAAMKRVLEAVNERREAYRRANTTWYHPVIFLLTDGKATDKPEDGDTRTTAFDTLLDLQVNRNWNYIPIAIGNDCDIEDLKRYQREHEVIRIEKADEAIQEVFSKISQSIVKIGNSKPGDQVFLPIYGEHHSVLS